MAPPQPVDLDIAPAQVSQLASADALAAFFSALGYNTGGRKPLTPESIGLTGDAAAALREIELLAEDEDGFLRVLFVRLRALTARSRTDLARVLGRTNVDHLLVLTSDFRTLEFVLLDKRRREQRGPGGVQRVQVVPLVFAVDRKSAGTSELRTVRRFTWTSRDGLEQFDKLRNVFEAATFSEDYFCNRALFADHYLITRLREDAAWRESPTEPFQRVRELVRDARSQWLSQGEQIVRDELFEPAFQLLGFRAQRNKEAEDDQTAPDYLLLDSDGNKISAAFTYAWDRWLDGPDHHQDQQTPDENPGACVVTALEQGVADWIIVTNGRQWRLYSRKAHSRATNFYEVDLPEALIASGDTDPNEAFRYWWLFFRAAAFQPDQGTPPACWLDRVAEGSSEYAKQLGERLKSRIFVTIFPHLARGFLEDRKHRLGIRQAPGEDDLRDTFEATLTLLYRLLFLLYAESRDLLPVREAPYHEVSLKKLKQEIAEKARIAQSDVAERLTRACSAKDTSLYDRLCRLFAVMDKGDALLNVPTYNGGLFISDPAGQDASDGARERELRIARFLAEHKVPDRFLALAIDLLARDEDEKTFELAFIDYKSLAVRHLGSIYEGLLEFRLKIADEDLTTRTEKGKEKFIPLAKAKAGRKRRSPDVVVRKGEVYLSNDKAERKASGSYYTPDPIVEYIVEHTVGPVLAERLEALRPRFRKVRRTFDNEVQKATAYPVKKSDGSTWDSREFALEKVYATHQDLVEELFEFRALDPAMGSGHFLVEAVDFLTDRLLTFLNAFPINPVQVMLDQTRRNILAALGEQGVTVDPAKLTDVNLLKRHVLKRCIYGVDLNPMAVELAKVSLWLDAFTLGAPLSFLDHHLRCGNSLIGSTFAELRETLKGRLFGVDYDPLIKAVQRVLLVNETADATAAEARKSASEYDQARRELSGYQIVLDLLVARYFGYPDAPEVLTHVGKELDLSTRDQFQESLSVTDGLLVQKVREVARQPDLRFFHWEIEFPEVFFDFVDADQRQLKHKHEIAAGSAGFDAVVGNPPYDELSEHEACRELPEKEYFRSIDEYQPASRGRLNLFRFFILRALSLLRHRGRHSFIVPMALLADAFTAPLRKRLLESGALREIIAFPQKDDPHKRVFFEAKLSTCIYTAHQRHPDGESDSQMVVRTFPGRSFLDAPQLVSVTAAEITLIDPVNWSIPTADAPDLVRVIASHRFARSARLGDIASGARGELMVNASFEKYRQKNGRVEVIRGSHIGRHVVYEDAKQGEPLYFDEERWRSGNPNASVLADIKEQRVVYQRYAAIDNYRRLIAAVVPAGRWCSHTTGYLRRCKYEPLAVAALLNSSALEWRFAFTSTNNNINAYELEALPIPRFERLSAARVSEVDWVRWQRILDLPSGVDEWETAVLAEMRNTPESAETWPDTIHDALAAAGKEMTRLAGERQRLTNEFSKWLVERVGIDEDRFSGMTHLRGGQADFDARGWLWFRDLLTRNRRACRGDVERQLVAIEKQHGAVAAELNGMRERFRELDAAIDRVVWQLIGLAPDGDLPSHKESAIRG